ncbi:hypothetical protein G8O24_19395 [Bradyrhizobium sp. INPA01-394B]|uniref:DUF3291 domain-containing protein n=1 Tax=Bradyrhizobium campsiandrae TaxID=1729892 RepID=A0ABR7UAP7_9BRAD|nr:hypothetical protein [Bradyrhizobium campsiandrae]MBC9879509.1 hypothetical protein [Bradyrhizobium campsiandrae]MBC9981161.1 hypothetical protein [Bradyrhizobium campsiandrae]
MVYVSMTGFRPHGIAQLPRFWWRTLQSLAQARRASGVVAVEARVVAGTYHTLTAWSDLVSMRSFVASGAHLKAMKNFRKLGTGRIFGYAPDQLPDWDTVYELWTRHGREV